VLIASCVVDRAVASVPRCFWCHDHPYRETGSERHPGEGLRIGTVRSTARRARVSMRPVIHDAHCRISRERDLAQVRQAATAQTTARRGAFERKYRAEMKSPVRCSTRWRRCRIRRTSRWMLLRGRGALSSRGAARVATERRTGGTGSGDRVEPLRCRGTLRSELCSRFSEIASRSSLHKCL
jgi:hypothetical protein